MNDEAAPVPMHKRAYGRGLFDGLRMAGIENPETFMNNARQKAIEDSLTGIARKVYEATPLNEQWSAQQICTELFRTGHRTDLHTVSGCLNSLIASGLIREATRNGFTRVAPKPQPQLAAVQEQPQPASEPSKPADPLSRLASLAEKARALSGDLKTLATEIESAALDVESRIELEHADTAKLRQLQQILKGL